MIKAGKNFESARYVRIFLLGCMLAVLTSLVGTTAWITFLFAEREVKRTEVFQRQLRSAIERQYKALSEETWTSNFESVHMRLEDVANSLGTRADLILIEGLEGECLYYESSENLPCQDAGKSLAIGVYPSISNASVSVGEISGKLIYRVKLEIAAIELGRLTVIIADPNNFLLSEGVLHFAAESMIVPGLFIFCLWSAWLLYAIRNIMRPYVAGLMSLQQKAAYAVTARQVGHDIQSPLVVVERTLQKATFENQKDRELIRNAVLRLKGIVSELATRGSVGTVIAESLRGTQTYENSGTYSLAEAITQVVDEKRVEANESVIFDLVWETPAEHLSKAFGKEHRVKRALSNVINNAIEASSIGQSIEIKVKEDCERQVILVKITDHGIGMDKATLARLGREEFSINKEKGTGIGFLWSKSVVENDGGSVSISSQLTVGTTVTLSIPCVIDSKKDMVGRLISQIFLVEDDPFIPDVILSEIRQQNFAATFTHLSNIDDLEKNLPAIKNSHNCLFILDYHVNNQTTDNLANKIKELHPLALTVLYSDSSMDILNGSAFDQKFLKSDLTGLMRFILKNSKANPGHCSY